ncbi:MAG TPA: hypothetical protein VFV35_01530 [Acidimicrobiales bacterium]|nr:hypothetical protein [Acidimicrobiales bacterium]
MLDSKTLALRITLPDAPGMLASMAESIAGLGGNIVDVDVHQIGGDHVVDDVIVQIPPDVTPAALRAALLEAGASSVVSTPDHHRTTDTGVRAIEAMERVLLEPGDEGLAQGLARLVDADAVEVVAPTAGQAESEACSRRQPVTLAVHTGDSIDHVLALPFPAPDVHGVVRLSRRGLRFTTTEVTRARALLRLAVASSARGAMRRVP